MAVAVRAGGTPASSPAPVTSPAMKFVAPMQPATKMLAGSRQIPVGVPACSITPSFITTMRSAMVSASSWSWVTMMVATPSRRCSAFTSRRSRALTFASRAESGSSNSRPGEAAMARASAMRCRCPPEIWAGYLPPRSERPTSSRTRSRIFARERLRLSGPQATLCPTFMFGNKA